MGSFGDLLGLSGLANGLLGAYGNAAQAQWQPLQTQGLLTQKQLNKLADMQRLLMEPDKKLPPAKLPEEELICATGGLIGWRAWNITAFGSTLRSFNRVEWQPFTKMTAECKGCAGECTCGIYAWKQRRSEDGMDRLKHIVGQVWLWGRVLECEHGFRAEFAYPKALVNTGIVARKMAQLYRVPLLEEGK